MLQLTKDSFLDMFRKNIAVSDAIAEDAKFVFYTKEESELWFWGWGKTLEEATTDALHHLDFNLGYNPDKTTIDQCLLLEIIPDGAEEIKSYEKEMVVKVTSDTPIPPGLQISIHLNF